MDHKINILECQFGKDCLFGKQFFRELLMGENDDGGETEAIFDLRN